jgi:ABC-type dipeptide/oligopeptide/nickel transport system permease subunit
LEAPLQLAKFVMMRGILALQTWAIIGTVLGNFMGYQSVGIQFVCSVFQNLMHKLPGTTFFFPRVKIQHMPALNFIPLFSSFF